MAQKYYKKLPFFDRNLIEFKPLNEREDRVFIEEARIVPDQEPESLSDPAREIIEETAGRIKQARDAGRSRVLAFGAHAIKNGLAPVFIKLIEDGWVTHLATNGAGIIHDWEFAYQGHSSEDVAANVKQGRFGIWEETGRLLNLALNVGAYRGSGYGEAIGALVEWEGLDLPSEAQLREEIEEALALNRAEDAAAAADMLYIMQTFQLEPGWLDVQHPFKQYGLQSAAYRLGVTFTSHPMFGHDIIYTHPMNYGAAIGRAAQRDFLRFARAITRIDGGVYISLGSAVMSPMIFEKSLSMAQNVALQDGESITSHFMCIVDLQESHWDWRKGEPPKDNPDYYLRYNKTFNRMGGTMRYLTADNRDFLLGLARALD